MEDLHIHLHLHLHLHLRWMWKSPDVAGAGGGSKVGREVEDADVHRLGPVEPGRHADLVRPDESAVDAQQGTARRRDERPSLHLRSVAGGVAITNDLFTARGHVSRRSVGWQQRRQRSSFG